MCVFTTKGPWFFVLPWASKNSRPALLDWRRSLRRSPPRSPRSMPPELASLCFRCLRRDMSRWTVANRRDAIGVGRWVTWRHDHTTSATVGLAPSVAACRCCWMLSVGLLRTGSRGGDTGRTLRIWPQGGQCPQCGLSLSLDVAHPLLWCWHLQRRLLCRPRHRYHHHRPLRHTHPRRLLSRHQLGVQVPARALPMRASLGNHTVSACVLPW